MKPNHYRRAENNLADRTIFLRNIHNYICLIRNQQQQIYQSCTYLSSLVVVVGEWRVLDALLRFPLAPDAEVVLVNPDESFREDHLPHKIRVTLLQLGGGSEMLLIRREKAFVCAYPLFYFEFHQLTNISSRTHLS